MFDWMSWPVLAGCLIALVIAVIVAIQEKRREQRRLEDVTEWAGDHGYSVEGGLKTFEETSLSPELLALPVFKQGRTQRIRNLVRGSVPGGGAFLLFDFRYVVPSGKNSTSIEQTMVAFELPGTHFPAFELRPEGVFARIGQALGDPDIDFDNSPEFSRQYQLRGRDIEAVRQLFERYAVPYLANTTGWSVEGAGRWLVVYRGKTREKTEDLSAFMTSARTVMQTLAAS